MASSPHNEIRPTRWLSPDGLRTGVSPRDGPTAFEFLTRIGGMYLGAAFAIDSAAATDALMARLDKLQARAQTALVEQILPSVFGTDVRTESAPPVLTFASLERLVGIAFRTIRLEEDHNRSSGQVFSPDERDNAEQARGAALKQLAETPGRSTFDALYRLAENPNCPIPGIRLREWARARAAQDSESAPWLPAEAVAFEQTAETAPRTPKDLQQVALRRLGDMQYDLLHADFAQGATVKALPDENAVQMWVADRLRLKQGCAYSVEREPHVVDEKEPDVRLRAKVSDASVAIEIKVPESWTLEQLEAELTDRSTVRSIPTGVGCATWDSSSGAQGAACPSSQPP